MDSNMVYSLITELVSRLLASVPGTISTFYITLLPALIVCIAVVSYIKKVNLVNSELQGKLEGAEDIDLLWEVESLSKRNIRIVLFSPVLVLFLSLIYMVISGKMHGFFFIAGNHFILTGFIILVFSFFTRHCEKALKQLEVLVSDEEIGEEYKRIVNRLF
ncbi:MAG: hypothetical protein GY757_30305 [bacterium]|nr:hypothetical protein [bacterium]